MYRKKKTQGIKHWSNCQKVFLILDNLRVHHSQPVKALLAGRTDKIEVFYLPSYSPELNPKSV
jgi:transposase